MTAVERSRKERLRSAALVRVKYQMLTGGLDQGFMVVYRGVLEDLCVTAEEVDDYIKRHTEELKKACLEGS